MTDVISGYTLTYEDTGASCIPVPDKDYLIIVRHDPKCNAWVVDEDSRHILEDDGKGLTPMELQVSAIRSLPQSKNWLCDDEE